MTYHYSPKLLRLAPCNGNCAYGQNETPHFETKTEGETWLAQKAAAEHGTLPKTIKKKAASLPEVTELAHNADFPRPQANRAERLAAVVEAVHAGANDAESLKIALNEAGDRDARYYADAAGYLGLLNSTGSNEYEVTEAGEVLATTTNAEQTERLIAERIQGTPEYQSYADGGTDGVSDMMEEETDLGEMTIKRRVATAKSWASYVERVGAKSGSTETEQDREEMRGRIEMARANKRDRDEAKRKAEEAAKPKLCPKCFSQLAANGSCMMGCDD